MIDKENPGTLSLDGRELTPAGRTFEIAGFYRIILNSDQELDTGVVSHSPTAAGIVYDRILQGPDNRPHVLRQEQPIGGESIGPRVIFPKKHLIFKAA